MAYADDAVKAKLSALNDTQDGIVTVAQWILFHRRHAERTAQLWLQRLKESPPNKRLNLVYLANEVVQQARSRKKVEFVAAFSPIIAEATSFAYKGSVSDIQQKIRRTVEVWRARQIFDNPVQDDVEKRLDEIDKTRGGGRKMGLGGSLFSGPGVPKELEPLVPLQQALAKADAASKPLSKTAKEEYVRTAGPDAVIPSPPVYAHRLNGILKTLANAESAVSETLKARRALISGLEKLLEENRTALAAEESDLHSLSTQKFTIESKKRDVEDKILRGLGGPDFTAANGSGYDDDDANRPEIESLTPPPVESLTPVEEPPAFLTAADTANMSGPPNPFGSPPAVDAAEPLNADNPVQPVQSTGIPGLEALNSAPADPRKRARTGTDDANGTQPFKRRSLGGGKNNDEMAAFANDGDAFDGLDDDVKGMLGEV